MTNPKPITTCPLCRLCMRDWALKFRNPGIDEKTRLACLHVSKSYRNGWLACAPGEAHTREELERFHDLFRHPSTFIGSAQAKAKGEIEELNARLHSDAPSSHA